MIIDFRVENFRSFRDEQVLSFVASKRLGDEHCEHCMALPDSDKRLLRAAVVWGANGAGKSNLFKAMRFAADLILHGTKPDTPVNSQPFLLSQKKSDAPSVFEFRFMAQGKIYSYGFGADDRRIHEEWLVLHQGKKDLSLIERATSEAGETSVTLHKTLKRNHQKVAALAEVGARPNQLFLTAIRDSIGTKNSGEWIESALSWFEDHLTFIAPEDILLPLAKQLADDDDFAKFAGNFLHCADTGVSELVVETKELNEEDLQFLDPTQRRITSTPSPSNGDRVAVLQMPEQSEFLIDKDQGTKVRIRRIKANHSGKNGENCELPLSEESDGTRRLLHLLPALYKMRDSGRVFVIDELDRSLHPMLSREFLRFFLEMDQRQCRQLVVTTHEDRLLDLDLLRRDEIWFVEKDSSGASTLHSLSDFKVRKDLKIDKGYLNGRFGGTPRIGHLLGILPEPVAPE